MLQNFLQSVQTSKLFDVEELEDFQLGKHVSFYEKEFPNLSDVQLAIIGVGKREANAVRSKLYQLSGIRSDLKIVDIGNLAKNTSEVLIPVIKELLDSNILPIIIGQQHHLTVAQYQAYHLREQLVNMVLVDKSIDFTFDKTKARRNHYFLNKILQQDKSYLLHLGIVGYQSHFVSHRVLQLFSEHQFDFVRLGNVRSKLEEIEPIIRDADFLSFDISAVRHSEAPASMLPSPSGLFSEEACKIAHYAGISDKMTSIGIYGFEQKEDNHNQTAHLIAQMIWYFIEGFASRKASYPINTDDFVEYVVDLKNQNYHISFWKSARSNSWWMQIPVKGRSKKYDRHKLVPCSYNDYKMACKGELPERLISALSRFT